MKNNDNSTNFLGFKIAINQKYELLKNIVSQVEVGKKLQTVFTPNPEQLVFAKSHSSFEKTLGKADVLLPDGIGIVIGSQILSAFGKQTPILERVTGVDVVTELLEKLPKKKILIIGGRDYEGSQYQNWKVVKAGSKLGGKSELKSKGQSILYWHEAFLNVSQPTEVEKKQLLEYIKKLEPDVVFVALGAPYQEEWIIENKATLETSGVRIAMVVGGAFDMLLGKVKRAPKWMQRIGLEWLFRLYQEPWRWRRQLNLLVFMKMVVQEALG